MVGEGVEFNLVIQPFILIEGCKWACGVDEEVHVGGVGVDGGGGLIWIIVVLVVIVVRGARVVDGIEI